MQSVPCNCPWFCHGADDPIISINFLLLPTQTLPLWGGGHLLPTPYHTWRLRRLNSLCAFGARPWFPPQLQLLDPPMLFLLWHTLVLWVPYTMTSSSAAVSLEVENWEFLRLALCLTCYLGLLMITQEYLMFAAFFHHADIENYATI